MINDKWSNRKWKYISKPLHNILLGLRNVRLTLFSMPSLIAHDLSHSTLCPRARGIRVADKEVYTILRCFTSTVSLSYKFFIISSTGWTSTSSPFPTLVPSFSTTNLPWGSIAVSPLWLKKGCCPTSLVLEFFSFKIFDI